MGFALHPTSFMAICVPSPQSIKRLLPENLTMSAVSHLPGSGIIPLVPSKHKSNIFPHIPEDFYITIQLFTMIFYKKSISF